MGDGKYQTTCNSTCCRSIATTAAYVMPSTTRPWRGRVTVGSGQKALQQASMMKQAKKIGASTVDSGHFEFLGGCFLRCDQMTFGVCRRLMILLLLHRGHFLLLLWAIELRTKRRW